MTAPLDATQRSALLTQFGRLSGQLAALTWERQSHTPTATALSEQLRRLWDVYEDGVPRVPLARCPFSGAVVTHSLDTGGLDGLWWRYESPVRPDETVPPTFLALTGAMRLALPVETTDFLVRPGPDAPYVLPHLLQRQSVAAVIVSLPVGRHTAYAMTYFSALPNVRAALPNSWGSHQYTARLADGRLIWGEGEEDESTWEFALRSWLEAGSLLWIAPDDPSLTLRSGAAGCPYLDLPGARRDQFVQYGEVTRW